MQYLCFFAVVFCSLYGGWMLLNELYNAIIRYLIGKGAGKRKNGEKHRKS